MSSRSILIVENEAVVAMDIGDRLTALGYEVAGQADSGEDALLLMEQRCPDLILMDIQLNGNLDGIATADIIRQRFQVPVVFLTAFSGNETIDKAKLAEPFGFIIKPFEDRELQSVIEIALYKHAAEKEILRTNRLYEVLSQVNQAIVHIESRDELLPAVCRLLVERGKADMAWIDWLDPETGLITTVAHCSSPDLQPDATLPCRSSQRDKKSSWLQPVLRGQMVMRAASIPPGGRQHADRCAERCPGCSCASFPLLFQGRISGALSVRIADPTYFRERETELLKEVATDISFALNKYEADAGRRQIEDALGQQHRLVETILNTTPEFLILKDREGVYCEANLAFCRFVGRTGREIIGRKDHDLFPPQEAEDSSVIDREVMMTGTSCSEDLLVTGCSGKRWLRMTKSPVRDLSGTCTGILCSASDITLQKQAEEDRAQLQRQVIQSQKMEMIGDLAGGVAHDFNNILASTMLHLDMLQQQPDLAEDVRTGLKELTSNAHRAANLTHQLLIFSRRAVLHRKPLNLNSLVENLMGMLRRLAGEKVDVTFQPGFRLPILNADGSMMEQILLNLTVNAKDAMPEGGKLSISTGLVNITTEMTTAQSKRSKGTSLKLSVSDTGCGMSDPVLKRIFEPFFTTKDVGNGPGLGLSTVHGIVLQHGGWIEVASRVGCGTTFDIYLPVAIDPFRGLNLPDTNRLISDSKSMASARKADFPCSTATQHLNKESLHTVH